MKNSKFKDVAAVFIIVFLLPYVVSVVLSGFPKKSDTAGEERKVCVAYEDSQENITLTQYLVGVLAAQIPVDYHLETLKAQAVLARTYYELHDMEKKVIEVGDGTQQFLTEEQMKNLWGDKFEQNYRKLEQAVIDTYGKCFYYNGKLAEPYFHAVSCGNTRDGRKVLYSEEYVYLQQASCEMDLQADNYVTIKTFTREELQEIMEPFQCENPAQLFRIIQKDEAGYVTEIEVNGQRIHGEAFRAQMQLPSAHFQVEEWEDGVRFVCKGLGHGFGMSLYTANELAKDGESYEDILNYFFKYITIKE